VAGRISAGNTFEQGTAIISGRTSFPGQHAIPLILQGRHLGETQGTWGTTTRDLNATWKKARWAGRLKRRFFLCLQKQTVNFPLGDAGVMKRRAFMSTVTAVPFHRCGTVTAGGGAGIQRTLHISEWRNDGKFWLDSKAASPCGSRFAALATGVRAR